uniref:Hydroxymethylglutaryl-CoA synthase n=1 Tax=Strongyloides papillosus TaxID=174720 RepID=A0A0N5BLI3_STREA
MSINGENSHVKLSIPMNVGIHALEFYFPKNYVDQSKLEEFDNVSSGKYTIGLGQKQMGFFCDHEDINSICLTVLENLLQKNEIDRNSIGYLSVGTETIIDKSKSVKTVLMNLFGLNSDIEGVDVKNACFGGTQALFSAIDWVYSNWETEKRYAIAVMGDVAIYEPGRARCTGGAGAFAVLIGPDAPFVFEKGTRSCYMEDLYDFYKPIGGMASDFPVVNSELSLDSYLIAAEKCYRSYCLKYSKLYNKNICLGDFDSIMFHCPFTRMIQKALAKLSYMDYTSNKREHLIDVEMLNGFHLTSVDELKSRSLLNACLHSSSILWETKTKPNTFFNARIGNMYTPSLYAQLVARIGRMNENIEDENILPFLLFSYGSGCASSMFSIKCNITPLNKLIYLKIRKSCIDAVDRLEQRIEVTPEYYTKRLLEREDLLQGKVPYTPYSLNNSERDNLFPGTFYLKSVDAKYVREYDIFKE